MKKGYFCQKYLTDKQKLNTSDYLVFFIGLKYIFHIALFILCLYKTIIVIPWRNLQLKINVGVYWLLNNIILSNIIFILL